MQLRVVDGECRSASESQVALRALLEAPARGVSCRLLGLVYQSGRWDRYLFYWSSLRAFFFQVYVEEASAPYMAALLIVSEPLVV